MVWRCFHLAAASLLIGAGSLAAAEPTPEEARAAMRRAAEFFHDRVASGGGYVWRYSSDLEHRQGEAVATSTMIWVQPPGTPAVGDAFLDAFEATGDRYYLQAAQDTAGPLVAGQLVSGGWAYHVELDPARRDRFQYRLDAGVREPPDPRPAADVGGWDVWRRREHERNVTILDDDVTQSTVRFLIRLDRASDSADEGVRNAVTYALESLDRAQYPNGAWSHNYDRFPPCTPDAKHYPVVRASYPETWSRTWTKDWSGCYMLNDRVTTNAILAMLDAYAAYGDQAYLASARRGAGFLLLAQIPDPQPAWAQQYDRHMHPVWDRPFEPPAITGLESQDVLETLLAVYRATGDRKYLRPIPRALDYLRSSQLDDGRLARFYELETNRPLYFERRGKRYDLTHMKGQRLPTHYTFLVDSRLDRIEAEYQRVAAPEQAQLAARPRPERTAKLAARVREIVDGLDERGAWTEPGWVRSAAGRKVQPPGGVIESATLVENMKTLCRFLAACDQP